MGFRTTEQHRVRPEIAWHAHAAAQSAIGDQGLRQITFLLHDTVCNRHTGNADIMYAFDDPVTEISDLVNTYFAIPVLPTRLKGVSCIKTRAQC